MDLFCSRREHDLMQGFSARSDDNTWSCHDVSCVISCRIVPPAARLFVCCRILPPQRGSDHLSRHGPHVPQVRQYFRQSEFYATDVEARRLCGEGSSVKCETFSPSAATVKVTHAETASRGVIPLPRR